MAWNGSNDTEGSKAKPSTKTKSRKPSPLRGVIAGLVVVFAALGVYLVLSPTKEIPQQKKVVKTPTAIKEVKPAAAPRPLVEEEKVKREIPFWKRDTTNGLSAAQLKKWIHHHTVISYTNTTSLTEEKPKYQVFDNSVDNRIACYLTLEPGENLIGTPNFDARFLQRFKESLESVIIPSEDDDEYTKELKKAVRDVKIDLANRFHNGEDICKVFEETHKEMQRYAMLKADIKREFTKFAKQEGTTARDIEDYLAAANKLLEEKGISPLKMTPMIKEAIRLDKEESNPQDVDAIEN